MKTEYNFSEMRKRRNPYANRLKRPITIRLGKDVVEYFKKMSIEVGIPYQNLINIYLRDCAQSHRKLEWTAH